MYDREASLSQASHDSGNTKPKLVNLALQGGGSHGAFAWGALDRILEDGRIGIEGIVGTSAGGMNAAVTAYGLTVGGNEGARKSLRRFWEAVAERGAWSVMQPSWFDRLLSPGKSRLFARLDRDGYPVARVVALPNESRELSPPARHLREQIDFEKLRRSDKVKLFVCASNVITNRLARVRA